MDKKLKFCWHSLNTAGDPVRKIYYGPYIYSIDFISRITYIAKISVASIPFLLSLTRLYVWAVQEYIPLPIVTKHEFGLPSPPRNLLIKFGANSSTIF